MPRKNSGRKRSSMHVKKGVGMLILGLLILTNALWPFMSWGAFIGAVVALVGLLKLVFPHNE